MSIVTNAYGTDTVIPRIEKRKNNNYLPVGWQLITKKNKFHKCLSERLSDFTFETIKNEIQHPKIIEIVNNLKNLCKYSDKNEDVSVVPMKYYREILATKGVIISCGFIIYTLVNTEEIKNSIGLGNLVSTSDNPIYYMLSQRRDTIQYIVVILGKYYNEEELKRYISLMTKEEQERLIADWSFEQLWTDVWAGQTDIVRIERSKNKFERYKPFIQKFISECIKNRNYLNEPEWGFIKGRLDKIDNNELDCAFREFEEETYCTRDVLTLLNTNPIVEEYQGTDGRQYASIYFIAKSTIPFKLPERRIPKDEIRTKTISYEIGNIIWVRKEKAAEMLHPRKIKVLLKADYFIKQRI